MRKAVCLGAAAMLASFFPVLAETPREQGSDRFIAADSAFVSQPVKGDLIAAGSLRLETSAGQDLYAAGGQVSFDGSLARNVRIAGGSVDIGPKARIDGKLRYRGGAPLRMDPAAQVQGGVEQLEAREPRASPRAAKRGIFIAWTSGLMLAAAVLVWALPGFSTRVADAARRGFGWSVLAGVLAPRPLRWACWQSACWPC